MARTLATLACLMALPLSACNRQPEGEQTSGNAAAPAGAAAATNETAAPTAAKATGTAPTRRPGLWETTTEMLEMKMEGAPALAASGFKPTKTVTRHCVTPDQLKGAVPNLEPPQHGGRCDIQKQRWSGGAIEIAMSCSGPNGEGRADIKSTGRYDDSGFSMDNETAMAGPNGVRVKTRMKVSGKRTGDCAG